MTITVEERERLRELIIAHQISPNQTEGMKTLNELLTRLLNALEALERQATHAEAQRDAVIGELLDYLAQWDGEWCPPMDFSEPGKTYTEAEARALWIAWVIQMAQ